MGPSDRERKYGMEPGDIASFDHGKCWICQQPETVPGRSLAIDHDHQTGAVRGFLCYRCNTVLGRMQDSPDLFRRAADYLDRSRFDFADACEQCAKDPSVANEDVICAPAGILEQDSIWTRFGYECSRGHRWACSHKTFGTPFCWRY